mmetsp:Transcript_41483/g.133895  ORF Transcript_41483/g.133895 Transcript_41483/m.133895 type:complete len:260 (-) Transcript_41483:2574-3353(-)
MSSTVHAKDMHASASQRSPQRPGRRSLDLLQQRPRAAVACRPRLARHAPRPTRQALLDESEHHQSCLRIGQLQGCGLLLSRGLQPPPRRPTALQPHLPSASSLRAQLPELRLLPFAGRLPSDVRGASLAQRPVGAAVGAAQGHQEEAAALSVQRDQGALVTRQVPRAPIAVAHAPHARAHAAQHRRHLVRELRGRIQAKERGARSASHRHGELRDVGWASVPRQGSAEQVAGLQQLCDHEQMRRDHRGENVPQSAQDAK